jgi:hypothetical protein
MQSSKQPRFPESLQVSPHKWVLTTQLYADEKFPVSSDFTYTCSPGCPALWSAQLTVITQQLSAEDVQYTASLGITLAEVTVIHTRVCCFTAVVAFV